MACLFVFVQHRGAGARWANMAVLTDSSLRRLGLQLSLREPHSARHSMCAERARTHLWVDVQLDVLQHLKRARTGAVVFHLHDTQLLWPGAGRQASGTTAQHTPGW